MRQLVEKICDYYNSGSYRELIFFVFIAVTTTSCIDPLTSLPLDSLYYEVSHASVQSLDAETSCLSSEVHPFVYDHDFLVTTGLSDLSVVSSDDGLLEINGPRLRSVTNQESSSIGVVFKYLGMSEQRDPFASGALRTQIALRVLYENTCNTYYAVWVQDPEEKLVISRKLNPEEELSIECGANGYETLATLGASSGFPSHISSLDGEFHTLFAQVSNINEEEHLLICCDGKLVLDILLADSIAGAPRLGGFRTDNGKYRFIPFGSGR